MVNATLLLFGTIANVKRKRSGEFSRIILANGIRWFPEWIIPELVTGPYARSSSSFWSSFELLIDVSPGRVSPLSEAIGGTCRPRKICVPSANLVKRGNGMLLGRVNKAGGGRAGNVTLF
jgi:hypothetical protein